MTRVGAYEHFIKIRRLTVNRVPNVQDEYRAITSVRVNHAVPERTEASAAPYRLKCNMANDFTEGLLFFEGGREVRIVAHDISQSKALLHATGLGLLPIDFYVTFDGFLTVAKCRLTWRHRDDIGVAFERWLDIRQRLAVH
jgi:hypothetical protein